MKQPRKLLLAGLGTAVLAGLFGLPRESSGQAANQQQAFDALITEISEQQTQIIANQKLMDEKVAVITENLRIAKIYVSRGGGSNSK